MKFEDRVKNIYNSNIDGDNKNVTKFSTCPKLQPCLHKSILRGETLVFVAFNEKGLN